MLRQGTFDKSGNVVASVTHSSKAIGDVQFLHIADDLLSQDLTGILALPRNFGAKYRSSIEMSLRARRCRKAENCRRVKDDGHAVRNHRMIHRVSLRPKTADHARNRVRHAMGKMNARVSESHSCV